MKQLTVFSENGENLVDSREVAYLIDKDHSKLLRDIRVYCDYLIEAKIGFNEYFIENSYKDSIGRELPNYLLTKKGCEMVANKLTGKKGIVFTAKYVDAFEKMQNFIIESKKLNNGVPFAELVKSVEFVAHGLKVNEASRILMYHKLYESCGQPTEFLPAYELNGSRSLQSATSLLKEFGFGTSSVKFNEKMRRNGYLDRNSRKSSNGSFKYYNSLTDKGLKFGENAVSPHNMRETQPLYYKDSFEKLMKEIENGVYND